MRVLLDVNASGAVARWLIERGYDVKLVSDVDPRMQDRKVLDWAWREGRVLVTTDRDFEESIWRERRRHAGIVRLENVPRLERVKLLEYVFTFHRRELELGQIVVATRRCVRIRASSC